MDIHARPVLIWRWCVFLLAGFYSLYQIWSSDYSYPFGPFRYLTIWALFASFFCASRMLALSERRSTREWQPVVATTFVLNVMVVYLYWSLFLKDPALVRTSEAVWWTEYYLHLAGPVLQWIDVLIVWRGFRRLLPAAALLLAVVIAYVAWIEFVLQPVSARPAGSVTSGLPYPFLNDMDLPARLRFYVTMSLVALGVLGALRLASGALRAARRSEALTER